MEELDARDAALLAALRGRKGTRAIERALDAGANPDVMFRGSPALYREIEGSNLDTARLLLRRGANPDTLVRLPGFEPVTMIFALAKYGDRHLKGAKLLKEFHADTHALDEGQPLLTSAIMNDGYKFAALCVEAGEDVNRATPQCPTALGLVTYMATQFAYTEGEGHWSAKALYLITELKADRTKPAHEKETSFEMAQASANVTLAKWLDPSTPIAKLPDYRKILLASVGERSRPAAEKRLD